MDDLHMPSVLSGPASGFQALKNEGQDKTSLLDLMAQKDRVDEELSALFSVLESASPLLILLLTFES